MRLNALWMAFKSKRQQSWCLTNGKAPTLTLTLTLILTLTRTATGYQPYP